MFQTDSVPSTDTARSQLAAYMNEAHPDIAKGVMEMFDDDKAILFEVLRAVSTMTRAEQVKARVLLIAHREIAQGEDDAATHFIEELLLQAWKRPKQLAKALAVLLEGDFDDEDLDRLGALADLKEGKSDRYHAMNPEVA